MDVKIDIDITSSLGEKVFDKVSGFVSTLIKPTVEESGLLMKDRVALYRFEKQIKILEKARVICDLHNISPKIISLKLLCPLLDFAGLEDNEILEDSWANLLCNMVDSLQNIDNHVFPYILSQISVEEYQEIKSVFLKNLELKNAIIVEYNEIFNLTKFMEKDVIDEIDALEKEYKTLYLSSDTKTFDRYYEVSRLLREKKKPTEDLRKKMSNLRLSYFTPATLNNYGLEEFEHSNLIRLGLIKNVQLPHVSIEQKKIDKNLDENYIFLEDLNFIVDNDDSELHLTELGAKFIYATSEKDSIVMPEYLKSL